MRRRTFLAALALVAAPAVAIADAATDKLDAARAARLRGDTDTAERLAREVLAVQPTDFRGNYVLGMVQLDRGQRDAGIDTLFRTVGRLRGPAPDPAIYNSLGWALTEAGRFDEADKVYAMGYRERDRMTPANRQALLNNMSLLARLRGQRNASQAYLQEAARSGNAPAKRTLDSLARVQAASR